MRLRDFGVASSAHPGRLSYLCPEQTRGELLSATTDVRAVGVMLFKTRFRLKARVMSR